MPLIFPGHSLSWFALYTAALTQLFHSCPHLTLIGQIWWPAYPSTSLYPSYQSTYLHGQANWVPMHKQCTDDP